MATTRSVPHTRDAEPLPAAAPYPQKRHVRAIAPSRLSVRCSTRFRMSGPLDCYFAGAATVSFLSLHNCQTYLDVPCGPRHLRRGRPPSCSPGAVRGPAPRSLKERPPASRPHSVSTNQLYGKVAGQGLRTPLVPVADGPGHGYHHSLHESRDGTMATTLRLPTSSDPSRAANQPSRRPGASAI